MKKCRLIFSGHSVDGLFHMAASGWIDISEL